MAQAGFTPISLYFSTTAAAVPLAANLAQGELAINITDGKLYYENGAGVVTLLASASGASGDVVGPASATDKAIATFDGTTGKLIQNNSGVTITAGILTATGFAGPLNGTVGATTANSGAFTTLSATGVTTVQAGTAALPAITTTGDTNTGIFFPAADTIAFTKGGVESMRIDSSGNVGIGTSSPSQKLEVYAAANSLQIESVVRNDQAGSGVAAIGFNVSSGAAAETSSTKAGIGLVRTSAYGVGALCFYNNGTGSAGNFTTADERMRIAPDGKVLINTTTAVGSEIFSANGTIATNGYLCRGGINGSFSGNSFNINFAGGQPNLWIDATDLGVITVVSDYRIKRNIETQAAPALERVMALRPVTYQMADYGDLFKAGEEVKEGFIAHEVQEVIPSGAEGVKDNPNQIQSLRVDAILSVAVKAIQEQQALITALTTRITALESI